MLDKARSITSRPVTYINLKGTLYRSDEDCLFPSRCDGVEHFLLKIISKLPDFEIVVNNYDWPFIKKHFHPEPFPLLSFSKTKDYSDIFYHALKCSIIFFGKKHLISIRSHGSKSDNGDSWIYV